MYKRAEQSFPQPRTTGQDFVAGYKKLVKSPLVQIGGLALLGGLLSRSLYNGITGTTQSLLRPFQGMRGPLPKQVQDIRRKQNRNRWIATILGGAALGGFSLSNNWNSNEPYNGLVKYSSFQDNYQPQFDWSRPINTHTALRWVDDPSVRNYDIYAANLGTSIVSAAAGGASNTTLGSIYDAAANKLDTKLKWQGVGSAVVRTGVANMTAGLFTKALDAVVGLPASTQQNLISAGTWAGAISNILN